MKKDIWKHLLLGGALYWGAGPNAAMDLQTGQVDPMIHGGPGSDYVMPPPDRVPRYVVPMPDTGAGSSLYVQPGEAE